MGNEDLNTSGKRIRLMRQAKGLTQAALAAKVYVTQPAVAQWEADKTHPQAMARVLLAEALGTTQAFLFPEPKPEPAHCCGECGR